MIEIQKFDTEQKIAESNRLIRNMFDSTFTKRQMDLIYAIISLVKPEDDEFKTYHISYKAIGEIFNPSNPDCTVTIKDIDKAVKGIVNKAFRMEDDKKIKYYQYVHDAEIDKEEKYIEFTLSKKVQEFYLQLQKGEYTSFLLKDILALSTNFQINLFRWLACNAGFKNTVKINIEDAKLHFYGKEVVTSRLIEKLDSALKAINERTNINATYIKIKTGKTITSLEFSIDNKYIKPVKQKTPAQIKAEQERSKAMWQENQELKEEIARLRAMYEKEVI